ncbi:MAG TPA: HAMP domain-containing sensor histidine kinase [Hanamia sp.]|nr:HAMP domain-containing sensor histidine kinase [Hanamia sp.]
MDQMQAFKNTIKLKPLRAIYIFYWFLLTYIIAALVFWFISLNRQNIDLSRYRLDMIDVDDPMRLQKVAKLESERDSKNAQYLAEGITSLLVIGAGAIFVFQMVRRQLKQSLQQQNFMMAITHELKTPVAVTKLNLETMQRRTLEYEQQQKLIRSTIQEANRLDALTNNMLLMSQMDAGGYTLTNEALDLGILAEDCAGDFIIRFPQRKIETYFDGELIITGDRLLLQLAVNNLLDNALKYSAKDDVVLLKVFRDSKFIRLQVIDEGKGVTAAEKDRIFEKYFRGAQRQTKGTGLGLYITKEIVKQHHADIIMTNNVPQGCIFEIRMRSPRNQNH